MKVAIVEDEKQAADQLVSLLKCYSKETGNEIVYFCYEDGLKFLNGYTPDFDLVFLDIETPFLDGIKASKELRKKDTSVDIVFVTNLKQYALKGYEVDALDFFVKPVNYASLKKLLMRVENKRILKSKDIVIRNQKGIFRIKVNDIVYVEVRKHYVTYHTLEGDYSFYGSLESEAEKLPDTLFAFCNKCYLVNLSFVEKVLDEEVYVLNNPLKISRGRRQDFRLRLSRYLSGN